MNDTNSNMRDDTFSTSEVAGAVGITSRNVMYLCALGVVPIAEGGQGKGSHRRFDCDGLGRLAVTAAFYNAGVEIYLAGKLVEQIGEQTEVQDLSNLYSLIDGPHSGVLSWMSENGWADNVYYLHRAFRERSNSYVPRQTLPYDHLIEIFDRTFVFLSHVPNLSRKAPPLPKPTALFKISGWKKGEDSIELHDGPVHRRGRLPREWDLALHNYKGMTRVNASLAIRDALDEIAENRAT
jgi:hypothetical protein